MELSGGEEALRSGEAFGRVPGPQGAGVALGVLTQDLSRARPSRGGVFSKSGLNPHEQGHLPKKNQPGVYESGVNINSPWACFEGTPFFWGSVISTDTKSERKAALK